MAKIVLDDGVSNVYLNDIEVDEVYYNSVLMWSKGKIPTPPIVIGDNPIICDESTEPSPVEPHNSIYRTNILQYGRYIDFNLLDSTSEVYQTINTLCPDILTYFNDSLLETEHDTALAKRAQAEAELIKKGVIIPFVTCGGWYTHDATAIEYPRKVTADNLVLNSDAGYPSLKPAEMRTAWNNCLDRQRAEIERAINEDNGNINMSNLTSIKQEYISSLGNYCESASDTLTFCECLPENIPEIDSFDIKKTNSYVVQDMLKWTTAPLFSFKPYLRTVTTGVLLDIDNLTITFTLSDVDWAQTDCQTGIIVRAEDYVLGLKLSIENNKAPLALEYISGAAEYSDGTITDFAEVGVEAYDGTTVKQHRRTLRA